MIKSPISVILNDVVYSGVLLMPMSSISTAFKLNIVNLRFE